MAVATANLPAPGKPGSFGRCRLRRSSDNSDEASSPKVVWTAPLWLLPDAEELGQSWRILVSEGGRGAPLGHFHLADGGAVAPWRSSREFLVSHGPWSANFSYQVM